MNIEDRLKINVVKEKIEIMQLLSNKVSSMNLNLLEERYAGAVKREYEYFEYINVIRSMSRRIMVKVNPDTQIHKFY